MPRSESWAAVGAAGFQYTDFPAAVGGIASVKLRTGPASKTSVSVRGRGDNLSDTLLTATT